MTTSLKTALFLIVVFIGLKNYAQDYKYRLEIEPVSQQTFETLYNKYYVDPPQAISIESLSEAKKLLKGIVDFDSTGFVISIKPKEGKLIEFDQYDFLDFVSYYPVHQILYLEGGHSADVSYNLITGQDTEQTGVPSYMLESPDHKFRLNGYFGGQECSSYFVQENRNGTYTKIADIDQDDLCNMVDAFWVNDSTLYYKLYFLVEPAGKPTKYYKLSISNK